MPLPVDSLTQFIVWAHSSLKIRSNTIEQYISSFNTIQDLNGLDSKSFSSKLIKTAIRGCKNRELYSKELNPKKRVVTLPILRILGNSINKLDWSMKSKQVLWTAMTVACFGSFRMGELLPYSKDFCPSETLLWSDIHFLDDDHVVIHVKIPKSKTAGGETVDLFSFKGFGVCPVKALKKLKSLSQDSKHGPVFTFENGKPLTMHLMNSTIPKLLAESLGQASNEFSCHCFRAGIPSTLASDPDTSNKDDILNWGRWGSDAYKIYTRLHSAERKSIFAKISTVLRKSQT